MNNKEYPIYYIKPLDDKYDIYYGPEYMRACGNLFACLITDRTYNNKHAIVIDEYFEKFPESVQKFFIFHEIGHGENNHKIDETYNNKRREFIKRNEVVVEELEADLFAFNKLTKYEQSILPHNMRVVAMMVDDEDGSKEFELRADIINKLIMEAA